MAIDMQNNKDNQTINTVSSNDKNKNGRTISFTIPNLSRPKIDIKKHISKAQAVFLLAVLIIGLIGGLIGGLIESIGYSGHVLMANNTVNQQRLVSSNGQLIVDIAKKLKPSVVSIISDSTTTTSNAFGFTQPVQQQSQGTGIIISSNGLVLTNRHVVPKGSNNIRIVLNNGVELKNISVVGRTSTKDSLDIAILKINNTQGQNLTPAVIGNSSNVAVGDEVVAIGNALGQFKNTVTSGIISGYGRNISASPSGGSASNPFSPAVSGGSENLTDLFQTDAAINEGNSGGPLVNLNGQVIGINTAIASNSQNIGFAIPINEVRGLINEVIKTGKFLRPLLGVRFVPITPSVQKQYHLPVSNGAYLPKGNSSTPTVLPGTAAAKAGLKAGDIITKVNNTPVSYQNDLATLIDLYEPGTNIKLTIRNGSNVRVLSVKLGSTSN